MACIKSLSLDDKSIMTKIEDIELQKKHSRISSETRLACVEGVRGACGVV